MIGYSIFRGRSALRDLPDECKSMVSSTSSPLTKSCKAMLLLIAGHADASHDILLGVTLEDLESAEYAAMHRGQTNWTQEHPLGDVDDLVHSILHRSEGGSVGEGGHTGYENAKYWAAGGPKALKGPLSSCSSESTLLKVYQSLCRLAREKSPLCVAAGVIAADHTSHEILADGGKRRTVQVPQGCWDPFCLINLCRRCDSDDDNSSGDALQSEIYYLQNQEFEFLLKHELNAY